MNLSQMTNFLIKVYSEQEAFSSASHLKSTAKFGEEVVQTVTAKSKPHLKKERRQHNQRNNTAKKEDLFAFHEWQNKNNQGFDNKNKGFGQTAGPQNGKGGNFFNRQGRKQFGTFRNTQNGYNGRHSHPNNGVNSGGNGNRNNNRTTTDKNSKPRKFVTTAMVGVNNNFCLKCNSPTHRFSEESKCIYDTANLMTKPCFNCQEGGHHQNVCIKNKKPTLGAQDPTNQEPLDPKFSRWPEANIYLSLIHI